MTRGYDQMAEVIMVRKETWELFALSDARIQDHPVGQALPDWQPPPLPQRTLHVGQYCLLEPLAADRHAASLYEAFTADKSGSSWTYLAYGPFASLAAYRGWLEEQSHSRDPLFFAIVDRESGAVRGLASYLRITPAQGTIEVGHIHYAPGLQRTRGATEAMYLLMSHAFALGYRRYEWKCDTLNAPSRTAAERLGFTFEGIFRQAAVVKGRNRDTAWYSVLDREWPALQTAFTKWLAADNFDAAGKQRQSLRALRDAAADAAQASSHTV